MRKILVCQHVPYEILGTLDPLFRQSGFRIRYANFGRFPDLKVSMEGYNGLVVLGGPMNVDETDRYPHLIEELRLIEEALKMNVPVLGICLGSQLLAKTLGAEVRPNGVKEIGWYDLSLTASGREDPVLRGFGEKEKLFQWHGYTFDMPQGACHLAQSSGCRHQAFRYGNNAYGFQFHLEVDERMIERWLTVPVNVAELRSLRGVIDPEEIRQTTPLHIQRLKELSHLAFGTFISRFGLPEKLKCLPSR